MCGRYRGDIGDIYRHGSEDREEQAEHRGDMGEIWGRYKKYTGEIAGDMRET